jgi:opacity protein-like surface antigen
MFVMTTNLKITLPAGRFEPYFVFGLGMSRSKVETIPVSFFAESSLDAALRGGGGLNFYLTRNLALTADVTYVWTGATDNEYLDYVSVSYGMLVKF